MQCIAGVCGVYVYVCEGRCSVLLMCVMCMRMCVSKCEGRCSVLLVCVVCFCMCVRVGVYYWCVWCVCVCV